MKMPILKGPRVTLRPMQVADAVNYIKWFKDPEVMLYFQQRYYKFSLKKEVAYIKASFKKPDVFKGSIINEKGEHIGSCDFKIYSEEKKIARFGIMIGRKDCWGKGYAGECIKLVADYVFEKMKYHRLELTVSEPNKKAIKAYTKAGFVMEGTMRSYRWNKISKQYEDECLMSILRDEWLNKK